MLANDLATYVLTIQGGQETAGGLDVSATAGVLEILPGATDTQKFNDEITHTAPKMADEEGAVTFSFQWQAPAVAGPATLYGAGNSVDLTNTNLGDAAGTAALTITVVESLERTYLPLIMD
jgi:hypothetical protein